MYLILNMPLVDGSAGESAAVPGSAEHEQPGGEERGVGVASELRDGHRRLRHNPQEPAVRRPQAGVAAPGAAAAAPPPAASRRGQVLALQGWLLPQVQAAAGRQLRETQTSGGGLQQTSQGAPLQELPRLRTPQDRGK